MKKTTLIQTSLADEKIKIIIDRVWGTERKVIGEENTTTVKFADDYSISLIILTDSYYKESDNVKIEESPTAPAGRILRLEDNTSIELPPEIWEEIDEAITEKLNDELPLWITNKIRKAKECITSGHVLPENELKAKLAEDWEIKEDDITSLFSPYSDWMSTEEIEKLKKDYPAHFFNVRVSVGQQIREARTKAGLTLRELADKCGIAFNHIGRIENGKYNVTIDTLYVLSKALDCPIRIG